MRKVKALPLEALTRISEQIMGKQEESIVDFIKRETRPAPRPLTPDGKPMGLVGKDRAQFALANDLKSFASDIGVFNVGHQIDNIALAIYSCEAFRKMTDEDIAKSFVGGRCEKFLMKLLQRAKQDGSNFMRELEDL